MIAPCWSRTHDNFLGDMHTTTIPRRKWKISRKNLHVFKASSIFGTMQNHFANLFRASRLQQLPGSGFIVTYDVRAAAAAAAAGGGGSGGGDGARV